MSYPDLDEVQSESYRHWFRKVCESGTRLLIRDRLLADRERLRAERRKCEAPLRAPAPHPSASSVPEVHHREPEDALDILGEARDAAELERILERDREARLARRIEREQWEYQAAEQRERLELWRRRFWW